MDTEARYLVRPLTGRDYGVVLQLINADWLPGQPTATTAMLAEAVAGRSPVDAGWWAELDRPVVEVLEDPTGTVVGVVSYATRPRDTGGVILWLHGREDPFVVGRLTDRAIDALRGCSSVEAFAFATALGLGLEALPVRHRAVTAAALSERGFVARDLWRYMRRRMPAAEVAPAIEVDVTCPSPHTRQLTVHDDGRTLAEATIGLPVAGTAVLWWISVDPGARGTGLGRQLLDFALGLLADLHALEVILYVDDDEPGGERDRTAANALYEAAGFTEVDRLHSYLRTH